jgi:proteasome lid subunit RPN8/RPN11
VVELPRSLAEQLIAHAREVAPDEACGLAGLRGTRVVALRPTRNAAATPRVRFTLDDDGYREIIRLEREGLDVGIYHSHPASPAYPSATDRAEMSATWPDSVQLMVTLTSEPPELNAYRIGADGSVRREALTLLD